MTDGFISPPLQLIICLLCCTWSNWNNNNWSNCSVSCSSCLSVCWSLNHTCYLVHLFIHVHSTVGLYLLVLTQRLCHCSLIHNLTFPCSTAKRSLLGTSLFFCMCIVSSTLSYKPRGYYSCLAHACRNLKPARVAAGEGGTSALWAHQLIVVAILCTVFTSCVVFEVMTVI
jgi:hypothetical protein